MSTYAAMPQQEATLPASEAAKIDQQQQVAKMNSLKALTGGTGTQAVPLQSSLPGPAGAQAASTNIELQKQFATGASLGAHDNPPIFVKGGKNKGKSNKKRRRWSLKYKKSINCRRPKGFSQRQHCKYGRKKTQRRQQKSSR
jgi:hypothetical protein